MNNMDMDPRYDDLLNALERSGYLRSSEVASAMRSADRAEFVPEEQKSFAYEDRPIPIGFDQTSSQPLVVSFMMELLSPKKGDRILDIGTGGGWQAAVLAGLTGDSGKVVTVERIPELHAFAKGNFERVGLLSSGVVECVLGDASSDIGSDIVFDRIISAAETDEVPSVWKNILAVGGRMVVPIRGSLVVAEKIAADRFETKEYIGFSFMPLVTGRKK